MKIIAQKEFNLFLIGKIRFSFVKKTNIQKQIIKVIDINISQHERYKISRKDEIIIDKEMRKHGSDLLTDGRNFYTTTGCEITKIEHPYFIEVLKNHQKDLEISK